MLEFFLEIDKQLFLILNGLHNGFFDQLMYYISEKTTWIPLYGVLLYMIFRQYRWKVFLVIVFVIILITLSDQLSVLAKNTFMRFRPCQEPSLEGLVHIVRGRCGGRYGFVSSHAANTFALAVFINYLLGRSYRFMVPVMLTYAVLNAYSRVYLGVHYPADVIFGALLGVLIGMFVYFLWAKVIKYTNRPKLTVDS